MQAQDPSHGTLEEGRCRCPVTICKDANSRGLAPRRRLNPESQKQAHACPAAQRLWVVRPPIHPRVRPAENGGEFSVLCFQPVALPRALCAQVARASAQATMATAHSGSARDRHWRAGPSGPSAQSRHTPPARVTGGRDPARDKLAGACTLPRALHPEPKRHHIRIEALPPVRARGPDRNDHLWDPAADCGGPCIPLRSGSYDSSSMVKGPS